MFFLASVPLCVCVSHERPFDAFKSFRNASINFQAFNYTPESRGMCTCNRFGLERLFESAACVCVCRQLGYFVRGIYLLVSWSTWPNAHRQETAPSARRVLLHGLECTMIIIIIFPMTGITWSSTDRYMCFVVCSFAISPQKPSSHSNQNWRSALVYPIITIRRASKPVHSWAQSTQHKCRQRKLPGIKFHSLKPNWINIVCQVYI